VSEKSKDGRLVEIVGQDYRITKAGLLYVTEVLIEEGYLKCQTDVPMDALPSLQAAILGTEMAEAAARKLNDMAPRQEQLDEEERAFVALLGLYLATAEAEIDREAESL